MPRVPLRCRAMPAALVVSAVVMTMALLPSIAHAGSYDVVACNAAPGGQTSSWRIAAQSAGFAAGFSCPTSKAQGGMYGYNATTGATVPMWAIASISFTAPTGASVSALTVDAEGGTSQDVYWSGLWAKGSMIWGCPAVDGTGQCSFGSSSAYFPAVNAPAIDFSVGCLGVNGCGTAWDSSGLFGVGAQSWFFVHSARVTVADSSAPSVAVAGGGLSGTSGWIRGTQDVTLNASDNVGIKGTSYAIDGVQRNSRLQTCDYAKAAPCPDVSGQTYSFDTRALSDGSHTLTVSGTDSANNVAATAPAAVRVDNTPPAAPSGVSVDQGQSWRAQRNYTVRWINPADAGSPVSKAYYRLCRADDPTVCEPVQSQTGSGISSLSGVAVPAEGDWLLSVYLEDQAGNASGANTSAPVHLRYDGTAPAQVENVRLPGGSAWRASNSFDVEWDTPSGEVAPLSTAFYALCDGQGSCSTGSQPLTDISSLSAVSVPEPGDYTLAVWLGDEAGNASQASASAPVHLRFDDVDPGRAVPAAPDRWLGRAATANGYDEQVALASGQATPLSGIAGFSVTTDGSDPDDTADTGPDGRYHIDRLDEGAVTVKARAVSGSGMASTNVGSAVLLVDRGAPEAEILDAPEPGAWQSGPVTVELRGHDQAELSGMDGGQLTYSVDDGPFRLVPGGSGQLTVSDDGEHTVTLRATDGAGNESAETSVAFKIDAGVPGLALPDATDGWANPGAGPFMERIRLAPGAHLPLSGVAGYSVTLDGSDPDSVPDTDASGEFEIPELPEGVTVVRARAVSGAGVASSEVGSAELRIDRTAPTLEASGSGPAGHWHSGPVDLTVRASDARAGMESGRVVYSVDGGAAQTAEAGDAHVRVAEDGHHEVTFRAVDGAGNWTPEQKVAILIDSTAPETVTLERPAADQPAEIAARVADSTSGVASGSIDMRPVGEGAWRPLPTAIADGRLTGRLDSSPVASGIYEFRASATDAAGNTRVSSALEDGTPLRISLGAGVSAPTTSGPGGVVPASTAGTTAKATSRSACKPRKRARHHRARHRHGRHKLQRSARVCSRRRGGEKHRHRHLTRKTHKPARKVAG